MAAVAASVGAAFSIKPYTPPAERELVGLLSRALLLLGGLL